VKKNGTLQIKTSDVLLCNAGSSTLKLLPRQVGPAKDSYADIVQFSGTEETLPDVLAQALANQLEPRAVVHRIVHAGAVSEQAQLMDDATLERIAHWSVLAPLHNPLALKLHEVMRQCWPHVPQYAVFDSGLYAQLPPEAARYALPDSLSPHWPLRRYGFHGLAHRNQWRNTHAASQKAGIAAPKRFISIHLGGGCSMSAWRDDRVIDTSMGFTPLEGMMMSTRSGSVDPGILLHLMQQEAMSGEDLNELLTKHSGLAALAPGKGDMREVMTNTSVEAQQAITQYCYQVRKQIGAFIAALGGVDAISIGGGVGENQTQIRAHIFTPLQGLGICLDPERNLDAQGVCPLHHNDSKTAIWLTPVNEMEEMLRQYRALESR